MLGRVFGSEERLHKRLLETGRRAQAQVLESRPTTASRGNFPPDRSERRYLWKLKLRLQPDGEPEFEVDLKHYFHDWSPPNPGSTMAVLFDPDDHSKLVIDIDSVVSAPAAASQIENASLEATEAQQGAEAELAAEGQISAGPALLGGWKNRKGDRALQDARLRSGQGMIEVTPGADAAPGPGSSGDPDADAPSPVPGSIVTGDQTQLLAQLTELHQSGQLSDADFEKAKRTLMGYA
jgi:hypothetical protein